MELIQGIRSELHAISDRVSLVIKPSVASTTLSSSAAPQQDTTPLTELQMLYNEAQEIKESIILYCRSIP
jgi:hypothetical protein